MLLKENTEHTSNHLRLIAGLVLAIGIAIAILLIIAGVVVGTNKNSYYGYYSNDLLYLFHRLGMATCFIIAAIIFFWHYVTFVMISAYATLVENSDRSDVVDALMKINTTLKYGAELPKDEAVNKAVDAVAKKVAEFDKE